MSATVQITFDAEDPRKLSAFWADVLGYVHPPPPGVTLEPGEDGRVAWDVFLEGAGVPVEQRNSASALVDPEQRGPRIFFQRVPEPKAAKNRVHLDVRAAEDLRDEPRMQALEEEAQRLVSLGARRVRRHEPDPPMSLGFIVMADPEGNEFCLD
ncbi:VOC family protein [Nesterenkonia sp.]|uniref:VOC family protein n=1 Tax=Nesterenkonia sp. TaxID=704201 RepID=UPI0026060E2B|nr:VOC family protein [Nesterenkonia sp.]